MHDERTARRTPSVGGAVTPRRSKLKQKAPCRPPGRRRGASVSDFYIGAALLMQRLAGCLFQALNFVLHHQFPALQFDNLQVVGGEMDKSFVQLVLQDLVLTLELNKMRLHTHAKPPR